MTDTQTRSHGTVHLDPDPSAWGDGATEEQAARWNEELAARVEAAFPNVTVRIGAGRWTFVGDDLEGDVRDFVNDEFVRVIRDDLAGNGADA